ncbi:ribonuclease H-like domain-containing protein [Tanacetum coccineum]
MDNPNITMEEYIRLEEEKARRRGKVYNWETAKYGKIWDNEDVHDLGSVETEFPAIVFNDTLTPEALLCEPTVSSLNNDEIDFRISFDESDNEDCTIIFDKKLFSYKIISVNDLKTDLENDTDKVNIPSFPSPKPTVSYFDNLDYFKDFEKEFPAIVYNDAQTSKLNFLTEPTLGPQHIDEYNFKDETSLSKCDEEEQNILNFNDLFPFNVIYPDELKTDTDNDNDKVDIEHSSGDLSVKPLPDDLVKEISTNVGEGFTNLEILKCWSLETSRRATNNSTQPLYPCVYLPSHQPPVQLVNFSAQQSPIQYHGAPAMSPAPVSHAPALPYAFHTMTLQNPNWNMDTGASSHLANNTGKHVKLPFYNSESSVNSVFEIIHSDIWTSPIPSESGIKYYAIFLDHFSHFCDHGGEYDNTRFHELFRQNGIQFWFSCPRTSQQNGKSERMLRTINNLIRTLLFQAHMPPSYWVEALNMAAHLLNILPSTAINNEIPFIKLYNQTPTYEHLRVFGCLCYPHVDVSHKLEPRSTPCIFLGYPANHRGYRCLDLASNKIIISRHVRFDEDIFPFGNVTSSNKPTYDFLLPPIQSRTNVPTTPPITPHPTTPPTSPPQPDTPPFNNSTPISPQPDTPPSHSSTPIPNLAQTQPHAQTVHSHTPIPINNSSQTMSTHPMVTRAKAGIFKPLERMNCHVTTTSPLPRSHVHALRDPNWKEAMLDEYNALITNGTWVLVPRPANVNVFAMTDLGSLNYFLGVSAQRTASGMFLSQSKFAMEILERENMQKCNPCKTPVDTESKLGPDGEPVSDPTLYRSLAGALQYLTFTRPDLSYVVQHVFLYMHDPCYPHFTALKRILRYVRGTIDHGLQLHESSIAQLSHEATDA